MATFKVEIVDVRREVEYGVDFGTCDLCASTGNLDYEDIKFRLVDTKGEEVTTVTMTNGEWDWGSFDTYCDLNDVNLINFMVDFNKRAFTIKIANRDIKNTELLEQELKKLLREYDLTH